MKLNSRQIDVLVNEIYKRIKSDPKYLGTDPESEKNVNELFEAYKQFFIYFQPVVKLFLQTKSFRVGRLFLSHKRPTLGRSANDRRSAKEWACLS